MSQKAKKGTKKTDGRMFYKPNGSNPKKQKKKKQTKKQKKKKQIKAKYG